MAEEYYIRGKDADEARGPYDMDTLTTLAEAGQIDNHTLYYDDQMESWMLIAANDELRDKIFPKKKSLQLRSKTKEELNLLNDDDSDEIQPDGSPALRRKGISVEDMLAAAEGNTSETRYTKEIVKWQNRAASIAVPTLATILLISALSYIYPSWEMIQLVMENEEGAYLKLFQRPLVFLGAFDLLMAIFLYLSATEVYPLLRFRAMFGSGFFGIIFWANWINGDPTGIWLALAVAAYGLGVYICTLTLNFKLMLGSAIMGVAGVLTFAYFTNLKPLVDSFMAQG